MPTVHDVARYLLWLADRERTGLDHLKLQKLVYYAQAFHLAYRDEPLFTEPLHAWRYGPVSPDLWSRYRYTRGHLRPPEHSGEEQLDERSRDLVEMVYERFRDLPASDLVRRTHDEWPWQEAMKRADNGGSDVILPEAMRAYYRNRRSILLEITELPPLEPVINLGTLEDVAAGILPEPPKR